MLQFKLLFLSLFLSPSTFAQNQAKEIFDKAVNQLVASNVELTLNVEVADAKGRVKAKSFDILLANFGAVDKTKIIMQAPERAKGITIVITNSSTEEGQIDVFTPANGKIRKMKATADNMALVGFDFFMTDYSSLNPDDITHKLLGKVDMNSKNCYKLEVGSKTDSSADKAEMIIDENTYQILQISMFDSKGNPLSITKLSDYKTVFGIKNKIQPMNIVTEDLKTNKTNTITIIKAASRNNLKESDFILMEQ